jgi:SecD/SecF fusion protein
MSDRQRHGFVLLVVLGLIAASLVIIATKPTSLGLDLKGGVELVYKASPTPQAKVTAANLQEVVNEMESRTNQLGVSQPQITTQGGDDIDVQLPSVSNVEQAENDVGETSRLGFYDWEANVIMPNGETVLQGLKTDNPTATTFSQGLANGGGPGASNPGYGAMPLYQAVSLAAKQPLHTGLNSASKGSQYYLFAAPGSGACKAWSKQTGKTVPSGQHCLLSGPIQVQPGTPSQDITAELDAPLNSAEKQGTEEKVVKQGTIVMQGSPPSFSASEWPQFGSLNAYYYVLRDNASLFGNEITNPVATTDSGNPVVSFGFTSAGSAAFAKTTTTIFNRKDLLPGTPNQHFAIALSNRLLSVPDLQSGPITGGQAEINGNFTNATAASLATQLRLGSLALNVTRISESSVTATLGNQALHQGLIAMAVGLIVVMLFLLLFYRVLGLIAIAGLVAYGIYFFALIKLIPITMTLAGIAGTILTIGVAADANIVIFERVKEEIRAGRSVRQGIAAGYKKGLTAIIDANVVTIMTAFILFVLATEDVKGFAFTLGVGTFVSLFTAIVATQSILYTLGDTKAIQSPAALGAGTKKRRWTFDFMGRSKLFFSLSGVILLIGALAIGGKGLNLGIDFEGGTQIAAPLVHQATVAQVKTLATDSGATDVTIQALNSGNAKAIAKHGYQYQIQSKYMSPSVQNKFRNALDTKYGIKGGLNELTITSVGPSFGSSVTKSAAIAIIISLLVISIYVALRFEWKFTIPVLIALMHDLLITAGVYALTGQSVSTDTVAALLTILGYSLYDTIIVFDRVRENIPRMPRAAFSQIVNRSMSEVLTRSLATTSVTLLPIIALLIFGGSTLKSFAFALMIGVASGAYSSIFIASPVLMHWKERETGFRNRRAAITAELGHVPAYAEGGDVDPSAPKRARRSGRLTTPDAENVSRSEFEQMKRELGLEEEPLEAETPAPRGRGRGRRGNGASAAGAAQAAQPRAPRKPAAPQPPAQPQSQQPTPKDEPAPESQVDPDAPIAPAPDMAENDGVADVTGGSTAPGAARRRPRNRKHGRR